MKKLTKKTTVREVLQQVGTEFGRSFAPNIWVNALMSEYKNQFEWSILKNQPTDKEIEYNMKNPQQALEKYLNKPKQKEGFPKWIITDMRFPNELEAVKDRNGITIRVNRHPRVVKHSENVSYVPNPLFDKEHPSETSLDHITNWDYVIDNNSTIEDLIKKVREILNKENII